MANVQPFKVVKHPRAVGVCGGKTFYRQRLAQLLDPSHRRVHFVLLKTFIRHAPRQGNRVGTLGNARVVFKQVKKDVNHE